MLHINRVFFCQKGYVSCTYIMYSKPLGTLGRDSAPVKPRHFLDSSFRVQWVFNSTRHGYPTLILLTSKHRKHVHLTLYTQSLYTQSLYTQSLYIQSLYTQSLYIQSLYIQSLYTQSLYIQSLYTQSLYTQSLYIQFLYTKSLYTVPYMHSPYIHSPYTYSPYTVYAQVPTVIYMLRYTHSSQGAHTCPLQ